MKWFPVHVLGLLCVVFAVSAKRYLQKSDKKRKCDISNLSAANVVAFGDFSYSEARRQFASKLGSHALSDSRLSPDVIVFADSDSDVVETIQFANSCKYKISIRSGGHQYAGFSSCSSSSNFKCIQLDVSRLETFTQVSEGRYRLGVGLTIEQVHARLVPLNVTIPMGVCKSVGVGGHFQSSSQGFLGRAFGLGMDYVASFRIAVANGDIVTAKRGDELYWAALGGSPGSWGVILDYDIDVIDAFQYPNAAAGYIIYPYSRENFLNIANAFLQVVQIPGGSDIFPLLVVGPNEGAPSNGDYTHLIKIIFIWVGKDLGSLLPASSPNFQQYIQPFLSVATPLSKVIMPIPIHKSAAMFTYAFNHGDFRYHIHSMSMPSFPSGDFVLKYADELDRRANMEGVYSSLQFQPYGVVDMSSAFNRNSGNAFPLRDTMLHVDDWVFFKEESAESAVLQTIKSLRKNTETFWKVKESADNSFMTTATAFDFKNGKGIKDLKEYYPTKDVLRTLAKIKKTVDPSDLFHSALTIPPKF